MTRTLVVASPTLTPLSTADPLPEGQSVVAVWQEVDCPLCYGGKVRTFECADDHEEFLGRCQDCPDSGQVGAVVATVEVTGKGHHADECYPDDPMVSGALNCAHDPVKGAVGCHTPTGEVTRLDVPIPMERTTAKAEGHFGEIKRPAPWWWADIDLEDDRGLPDRNGGY